ncbi:hypothetical protein H1D32_23150 [Anaerobacillus sp. CMMVII]|nr:hypothetical protein [Anaerobacillus sp. CMMVII]MCT8140342.1 hypothetical protein [Anaerobacillus sp. CMMVII]
MDKKVPKSIVKSIRYIKQDATDDQLDTIKQLVIEAIDRRKAVLNKS